MTDASKVAQALSNNRKSFREYKRNQSNNDGWESGTVRASYDQKPSEMNDDQIVLQNKNLLRLQEKEDYLNNTHMATEIAKRRNELWQEAKERGIEKQLQ